MVDEMRSMLLTRLLSVRNVAADGIKYFALRAASERLRRISSLPNRLHHISYPHIGIGDTSYRPRRDHHNSKNIHPASEIGVAKRRRKGIDSLKGALSKTFRSTCLGAIQSV